MLKWKYSNYSKVNTDFLKYFPFNNPRDNQLETISEIMDAINNGYEYIILESGTGTGKSAIATTLANIFQSTYILTHTKQLQQQYLDDFSFNQVKGRSNFNCLNYSSKNCDEGKCLIEGYSCEYSLKNQEIPSCPYYYQKYLALNSKTVISNYPYMFLELNYVKDFNKRRLLICDEAHNLESILMNQLKIEFFKKDLKKYINFDLNENIVNKLKNSNLSQWVKFIEKIKVLYVNELEKIKYLNKPYLYQKIIYLKNQINACNRFIENIKHDEKTWIFDYDENLDKIEFKPLKIDNYAQRTLFEYADVCLFMSATILDYELFTQWLGIPEEKVYPIRKKTTFNTKQNPILASNKYNLSKSLLKQNAPKSIKLIKAILNKHKNEKGIIHTVSSQCMYYLMGNVGDARLIAHDNLNKAQLLENFKNSTKPLVLISPSMDEGVDLPDDLCRFQIIYKIPYPDLGDEQIKLRSQLDPKWYDYKTALKLVQMHGRGMRNKDDYCKTYFIDNRLKDYILKNQFLPDTFKSVVEYEIPREKERLIKKGDKLLKNNDYEKAIRFYSKLINNKLFKGDYIPYLKLAVAYHETALYESEVQIIIQFLNLQYNFTDDVINLFRCRLNKLEKMGYV